MWSKAQSQLAGRTSFNRLSSTSSLSFYVHFSGYLLEPQQETLMKMIESLHCHHLLVDYFEASVEAYNVCELLLRSVHQTRTNYRRIQRVIKISENLHDCRAISKHLVAFASSKNPLSIISTVKFRDYRDGKMLLFSSLTSKGKKIRRRAKFNKLLKKVGAYSLVISQTALLIALLVLILHSMVGIVAAPGLMVPCLVVFKRKLMKLVHRGPKTSLLEKFAAQLDVAAKGVYILINDFDTISRMVKRLHDEVEHRKDIAKMCFRSGNSEILKEVVKEFHMHESSFLEQLKELEDHICLCFLTINRSRRLVLQEIMVHQDKSCSWSLILNLIMVWSLKIINHKFHDAAEMSSWKIETHTAHTVWYPSFQWFIHYYFSSEAYGRIGIKIHYITFYDIHSFITFQFSFFQLVTSNLTCYLYNREAFK